MIRNIIYQVLQGLAFIHKHGKGGFQIGKSVKFLLAITLIINFFEKWDLASNLDKVVNKNSASIKYLPI